MGRSARRRLSFDENHDLRGAEGPRTPHRDAADDPPALGRIAVERVLEVLRTELAAPPAVFLRQHFVFRHGNRPRRGKRIAASTVTPRGYRPCRWTVTRATGAPRPIGAEARRTSSPFRTSLCRSRRA